MYISTPSLIYVYQLMPITVSSAVNVPVSANTNILQNSYTPPTSGKLRITFVANSSGVLSIVIASDSNTYVYQANGGSALTSNALYTFELPVTSSYSYNLQYSTNATVTYQIDFIPG